MHPIVRRTEVRVVTTSRGHSRSGSSILPQKQPLLSPNGTGTRDPAPERFCCRSGPSVFVEDGQKATIARRSVSARRKHRDGFVIPCSPAFPGFGCGSFSSSVSSCSSEPDGGDDDDNEDDGDGAAVGPLGGGVGGCRSGRGQESPLVKGTERAPGPEPGSVCASPIHTQIDRLLDQLDVTGFGRLLALPVRLA